MKKRGFTLLELILTIALIGIVTSIAYNFLIFGARAHQLAIDEFEVQSSTRIFAENVNKITRFATSTHTVPKSSFQDLNHRDPNWSYIGIDKHGDVILDEPGSTLEAGRRITTIAKKTDGIAYSVSFLPVYRFDGSRHDTLMKFVIDGYKNGNKVMEMSSEIEVMNSHQIEHRGSLGDPAVALSFTNIDRDSPEFINVSPDAHIAMVIDVSGSMDWAMGGQGQSGDKRIIILKEKALNMVDKLSNMGFDIYVTIVPFSNNGDNPSQIKNINRNNPNNDLAYINNFIKNLKPDGSTNTGDGIRRAYYQLETMGNQFMLRPQNSHLEQAKKYTYFTQHMMILVDGETNQETETGYRSFFGLIWNRTGLYTGPNTVSGNSSSLRVTNTSNRNAYVDAIGNNLIKNLIYINKYGDTEQVIKSFVIGFSAVSADHASLENIGHATNAKEFEQPNGSIKRFIIATDADELDFAFGSFTEEVSASLWSIYGPSLQ